jgi:hypothetical protein
MEINITLFISGSSGNNPILQVLNVLSGEGGSSDWPDEREQDGIWFGGLFWFPADNYARQLTYSSSLLMARRLSEQLLIVRDEVSHHQNMGHGLTTNSNVRSGHAGLHCLQSAKQKTGTKSNRTVSHICSFLKIDAYGIGQGFLFLEMQVVFQQKKKTKK